MITFADVSFWQGTIDWATMKEKAQCVIIRAGQATWVDSKFSLNWQSAKEMGIDRGCYWYYDNNVKPSSQVEKLKEALGDDLGEGVIWLDLEDRRLGTYMGWQKWATMLELMMEAFPDKVIGIYTAPYFWLENTIQKGIPDASLEWFSQFPLWIANYQVQSPSVPVPWKEQVIWQYGTPAVGEEWGVESKEIDMNLMEERFYSFCFGDEVDVPPVVEPPVEPEPSEVEGKVVSYSGVNLRLGTGIENTKIGALWRGSEFDVEEIVEISENEVWVKPKNVWVAAKHDGTTLVELTNVIVEPEPPDPPTTPTQYWRVLHDVELKAKGIATPPDRYDVNDPEVFLLQDINGQFITKNFWMTEEVQIMSYSLYKHGTPRYDEATRKKKWRVVHNYYKAFSNKQGFDRDGDPRADFISRIDLDEELPAYDKARVCGGATLKGQVVGDRLKVSVLRNAVDLSALLDNPHLYFTAIMSGANPANFPQCLDGDRVLIPLVSPVEAYFPLNQLEPVSEIADPYWINPIYL